MLRDAWRSKFESGQRRTLFRAKSQSSNGIADIAFETKIYGDRSCEFDTITDQEPSDEGNEIWDFGSLVLINTHTLKKKINWTIVLLISYFFCMLSKKENCKNWTYMSITRNQSSEPLTIVTDWRSLTMSIFLTKLPSGLHLRMHMAQLTVTL